MCEHPGCKHGHQFVEEFDKWIEEHAAAEADYIADELTLDFYSRRYNMTKECVSALITVALADVKKHGLGGFTRLISNGILLEARYRHQQREYTELQDMLGVDRVRQLQKLLPAAKTNAQDNEYEHLS